MNFTLKKRAKELLHELNVRAKKRFGQNFLVSERVLDKILQEVFSSKPVKILEIGPGLGFFLEMAIKNYNFEYVGVEIDPVFGNFLRERFSCDRILIITGDFLKTPLKDFSPVTVFGSIPYNLSSSIIEKFCYEKDEICHVFVILQKEFGMRVMANPGSRLFGRISILVQIFFKVEKLLEVSKNCFFPTPQVDSVLLKLTPKSGVNLSPKTVGNLTRACFAARRKTILNNVELSEGTMRTFLREFFSLRRLGSLRPEQMPLEIWEELFQTFESETS
ncbi:MAG: 16S rRNA (adenine(1518)-N(6)/adenine(1519)-N(6))-dimethyltransferase RsmA [Deltaproteobacteria bacterium]|nr:16S rRNA (adenine(1518)-N(6)/adenine(1519)-N(6))-dimethyltransferase RsmA [Deltaproteobacteria bacterium]MCX7952621.1 16S rRNA (adenine(1518)-N(6)/adenine(1519)-N(6))-dimethyltransferase RsmA [Deltaproteobacteria bacterium]